MGAQAPDLAESAVAKSVDVRHAEWGEILRQSVNTLHEKVNPYGGEITEAGLSLRMTQADIAVRTTGLDMVEAG